MKTIVLYQIDNRNYVSVHEVMFEVNFVWYRKHRAGSFLIGFHTNLLYLSSSPNPIIGHLEKSEYYKTNPVNYEMEEVVTPHTSNLQISRHPISWVSFKCYMAIKARKKA